VSGVVVGTILVLAENALDGEAQDALEVRPFGVSGDALVHTLASLGVPEEDFIVARIGDKELAVLREGKVRDRRGMAPESDAALALDVNELSHLIPRTDTDELTVG